MIEGSAITGSVASGNGGSDQDEDASKDGTIDPADFLEAGSGVEEDEEDNIVAEVEEEEEGELVIGEEDDADEEARRSDTFRTNTSKNKLESLLGKEFKHPRRKCSICGYTVSYSNFKRHLRNAHPLQYR